MATITLFVDPMSKSWTVSPADVTRIIDSLKNRYGRIHDEGSGALRDMTDQETFDRLTGDFIDDLKNSVLQVEGDAAAVVAQATITEIEAT